MAEIKTKPTTASVAKFIASVTSTTKREDAKTLVKIMERVSGEKPVMWGPSIIGFGKFHYKYASGHEADMCRVGFSPRSTSLTLYIMTPTPRFAELIAKLGKHKTSKACLYINKLADVDVAILEQMIAEAWQSTSDECLACKA